MVLLYYYLLTIPAVVSEKYDEVVFTNPKFEFHKALTNGHKKKQIPHPLSKEQSVMDHFKIYGDEEDVKKMLSAKKFLEGEIKNVTDRFLRVDKELEEVKHSLTINKRDNAGVVSYSAVDWTKSGEGVPSSTVKPKIKIKLPTKKKADKAADSQPTGKKTKSI